LSSSIKSLYSTFRILKIVLKKLDAFGSSAYAGLNTFFDRKNIGPSQMHSVDLHQASTVVRERMSGSFANDCWPCQ